MCKWLGTVIAVSMLTVACAGPVHSVRAAGMTAADPVARAVAPDHRIGALFVGSETMHSCSASVIDSATGDLILTAAHCVVGGADAYFVPGFRDDAADADYWHVDAVYLDPRWLSNTNPLADFAIARVSHDGTGTLEAVAGGGFTLGVAPHRGTEVTLTGYPFGVGGGPIGCHAATAADERGYPALVCAGLSDGTSGSPWVAGSAVTGLTGGLDGGGCDEDVSYSPPLDGAIVTLLHRAEAGGPGDDAPTALGDC
jgi:hypothetical protein